MHSLKDLLTSQPTHFRFVVDFPDLIDPLITCWYDIACPAARKAAEERYDRLTALHGISKISIEWDVGDKE